MRLRSPVPCTALAACSLLAALAACSSSDGRTLPPPDSHRTTTSVSTPVVGQPSDGGDAGDGGVVEVFSLFSGAFVDGGPIPARYTCAGEGVSPPLSWTAVPAAAELALVVRDPDAGGFVHWVVTGIDPAALGFGEGGVPESAVEAANQGGQLGWTGPCPPEGDGPHTYVFTLHALPEPLDLAPGTPGPEAAALVEGASSDAASVTGTFSR